VQMEDLTSFSPFSPKTQRRPSTPANLVIFADGGLAEPAMSVETAHAAKITHDRVSGPRPAHRAGHPATCAVLTLYSTARAAWKVKLGVETAQDFVEGAKKAL
jgi:hypothetical protein